MAGERPSCRWCIALFIGYELGKTGPGVGSQMCGNVPGSIGDASRVLGGIDLSEGVASTRGGKPMLARCLFRAVIVAAVIMSRDCGVR